MSRLTCPVGANSGSLSGLQRDDHRYRGLEKHHGVEINGTAYRVTHIGADEEGRTRVTLAYGAPGKVQPDINKWS